MHVTAVLSNDKHLAARSHRAARSCLWQHLYASGRGGLGSRPLTYWKFNLTLSAGTIHPEGLFIDPLISFRKPPGRCVAQWEYRVGSVQGSRLNVWFILQSRTESNTVKDSLLMSAEGSCRNILMFTETLSNINNSVLICVIVKRFVEKKSWISQLVLLLLMIVSGKDTMINWRFVLCAFKCLKSGLMTDETTAYMSKWKSKNRRFKPGAHRLTCVPS